MSDQVERAFREEYGRAVAEVAGAEAGLALVEGWR